MVISDHAIVAVRAGGVSRLSDIGMRAPGAPMQQRPLADVDEAQLSHVSAVDAYKRSKRPERT